MALPSPSGVVRVLISDGFTSLDPVKPLLTAVTLEASIVSRLVSWARREKQEREARAAMARNNRDLTTVSPGCFFHLDNPFSAVGVNHFQMHVILIKLRDGE